MGEVKRNHHLPRFYLDAWADQNGRVALRRRGERESRLTSVRNVGVVNRLYTPRAESLLGRTETAAAPVIKKVRNDVKALDSRKNRSVLARFMVELMARQTNMASFMGLSHEVFVAILESSGNTEEIFEILRVEHGPYVQREDAGEVSGEVQRIRQELREKFPDLTADEIKEWFYLVAVDPESSRSLHSSVVEDEHISLLNEERSSDLLSRGWLVCESTGKEFITSDQPVFKHPTWLDRNGISPHDTLCFIVSPTILLKMGDESGKYRWGEKEVHELNLYIAEHCDHQVIASPSNEDYLSRIPIGKNRPWTFARSPQPPRVPSRVAS